MDRLPNRRMALPERLWIDGTRMDDMAIDTSPETLEIGQNIGSLMLKFGIPKRTRKDAKVSYHVGKVSLEPGTTPVIRSRKVVFIISRIGVGFIRGGVGDLRELLEEVQDVLQVIESLKRSYEKA